MLGERPLMVVLAKAGTHNHRIKIFKMKGLSVLSDDSGRIGPRLRGDDKMIYASSQ